MCGISGFLSIDSVNPAQVEAVERISRQMSHRGPDERGLRVDGPMVLGHRRLSIIDLSPEAAQPMSNEDDSILLVINGEIYNFAELRKDLESRGHLFRTNSDSEVAIHLYEERGVDFLDELRGMFALALWDANTKRLVLARDRFGQKPIFYHVGPQGLVFASELQALVASEMFPREPEFDAIDAYLALQYVPSPLSAYRNVFKLPPGHRMVCGPGDFPDPEPYFQLRFDQVDGRSQADLISELRSRLEEAVRIRLVSDVPLGAFLSGGIDSSLIVALMARASNLPVKTFSIGFPSKDHSELGYARQVAEFYQTEHHEMIVDPDMVSVVPDLVEHYGEPYGDTSAVPTWYLSKFTRQSVTVALSGDAGDEAFAGYNRYRYAKIARLLRSLPGRIPNLLAETLGRIPIPALQPVRDFGRRLMQPEVVRYLGLVAHFPWDDRKKLYSDSMAEKFNRDFVAENFSAILDASTAQDAVGRLLDLDIHTYLPDDILVKVDIASMAHSLEARCPLLDHHLMSFVASVSSNLKMRGFSSKYLLRQAVRDILPPVILKRRKQGFALPIDRWMRQDLAAMAHDVLLDSKAKQRGLFKPAAIEKLLNDHKRGESRGLQIWNLLMLEQWFRKFIDGSLS
jgi:asparagine synthase (glutamine-hydrolysing)